MSDVMTMNTVSHRVEHHLMIMVELEDDDENEYDGRHVVWTNEVSEVFDLTNLDYEHMLNDPTSSSTLEDFPMDEVLTIAEIRARFNNHWILIDQPVSDEQLNVLSGRVVFASPDRDEVYHRISTIPGRGEFAIECTIPTPSDMEFLL